MPAGGTVLDVACGAGRHVRWFQGLGHRVTALDRSPAALAALDDIGPSIERIAADIEAGPWPLHGSSAQPRRFDALVVTNYLWRPLWPVLLQSLAPGGVLLYETFSVDHASIGRPARPEFLLRHGELLEVCAGLRIVAYEDGFLPEAQRFVQRIAAMQPQPSLPTEQPGAPPRYPLQA